MIASISQMTLSQGMTNSETMQKSFAQLRQAHLNFLGFSSFCAVFLRTSDGGAIRHQGDCHFRFKALEENGVQVQRNFAQVAR